MEFLIIAAVIISMHEQVSGSVTAKSEVEVFLTEKAILECVYSGEEKWYLMQWKKKSPGDASFQTIVTVTSSMFEPEYSRRFEGDFFRMRADIRKDRDDDRKVAFDLSIYNIQCKDEGIYQCVITAHDSYSAQTFLRVSATPEKPQISYEILALKVNQSYTLHCEGNVGNPAGVLHWFVQNPTDEVFSWVQEQDTLTSEKRECTFTSLTSLTITVTENSDGTVYRCAVESPHIGQITSNYFDEVTVRLPEKPQKQCDGAMCGAANFSLNMTDSDYDGSDIATNCKGSVCLLATVHFLFILLRR